MDTQYAVYLGKEQQNGFTGFHAEKNFFCVVEIFDGYTLEQGEDLMTALAQAGTAAFDSLNGFDASIAGILRRHSVPIDTSVAVGFRKDGVLYLKTVGSGEIYIHRGKATERIIFGNTTASGRFHPDDVFIFTTSFFTQSLKGIQRIRSCIHSRKPITDYPDMLKSDIGPEDDTGAVALLVQVKEVDGAAPSIKETNVVMSQKFALPQMHEFISKIPHKKYVLWIGLAVCVGVLFWNVAGSIVSKKGGVSGPDISRIEKLVDEANEVKDDREKALLLLEQSRDELSVMKKSESVTALMSRISSMEDEVLNRQTKEAQEFYELSLEGKKAQGAMFNVSDATSFILDPVGNVYVFSLEKKSFEKRAYGKPFSQGSYIAGYEKKAYVLDPQIGVIEFPEDGKPRTVVKKDGEWKEIGGLHVYNGNLYVLERGDGNIYKYPVFSEGFGDKVSYFKGSYDIISENSSFAIDSAVYVQTNGDITKYLSGLKEKAQFTFPQKGVEPYKIIAHTDSDGVTVWDRKKGTLILFSKDGSYQKQIVSSSLKTASDVEIVNKAAYLLKGATIYRIEL